MAAVALWNLLILCITYTSYGAYFEYRYHLIGMVPVLLLFAMVLPRLRSSVRALTLLGVLALTVMTNWDAARATAPAALQNSEAAQARQLLDALAELEQPYHDVFYPPAA